MLPEVAQDHRGLPCVKSITERLKSSMLTRAMAALVCLSVASCTYLRAITFDADSRSGSTDEQHTILYLLGKESTGSNLEPSKHLGEPLDPTLIKEMTTCVDAKTQPEMAPLVLLAPLIGFAIQQGISTISDAMAARVDELRARSQRSYSTNVIVDDPADINEKARCILLVRGSPEMDAVSGLPSRIDLAMLLAIGREAQPPTDAVVLRPTYLRVDRAVAVTGNGKPIDLSFAIAAKSVRVQNNVRKVEVYAQHTFTISSVALGSPATALPTASGLVPLAPTDASRIEISVGVTETGTAIPDADRAKAEVKALAAALGPAFDAQIRSLLPAN